MKLLNVAALSLLLAAPTVALADEYTTGDGNTVSCNGYDASGNWVPCPSEDSSGSSSSLSDQWNAAKDKWNNMTNPNTWTGGSNSQGGSVSE
ncbi:hypothetical protein [Parvibaculum sp.]|uniref:hypothetical protein n=1 Tax=Parvibaculum sp. TaxID=2024848 RepID=UPI00320F26AD